MIENKNQMIDSLSVGGNNTFIAKQLKYFEEEILKKEINEKYYNAPNYYAWLLIASEYVLYRIREMIYFNFGDHNAFDASYSNLLNDLFSKFDLSYDEKEDILFFVKTRHLLTHKGFPNAHIVPSVKNYKLCKGHSFSKNEISEISQYLQEIKNYNDLKRKFYEVLKSIGKFEKPVKQDFGFMCIEKIAK